MALVQYSSSEAEESDDNENDILESPSSFLDGFVGDSVRLSTSSISNKLNDPSSLKRVRGFAHQHGNWATSVFIPTNTILVGVFSELLTRGNSFLATCANKFSPCDDVHMSLTKTWPLLYHWIPDFTESVRRLALSTYSFSLRFDRALFLVNENKTRSFVAVIASHEDIIPLTQLVQSLDPLVKAYRGEAYYKNPVFHFSLAWCLGDVNELMTPESRRKFLSVLSEYLIEMQAQHFLMEHLVLKTGDKQYMFTFL